MSEPSPADVPPQGRLISAVLVVASVVGLLLNHFAAGQRSVVYLLILSLAPIGLFVGLGGIVEPKILWSVGKYGQHLPPVYKAIGVALGSLGVVVTILLVVFVYRFGAPR